MTDSEAEVSSAGEIVRLLPVNPSTNFELWVEPLWSHAVMLATRLTTTSHDRDDLLQDALMIAWRRRSAFDASRGSARNWLLAIVLDASSKAHRRARWHLDRGRPTVDAAADTAPSEVSLDLRRTVGELPARQRAAVALFYYLDYSVEDAAAVMGCSVGTVKSTLFDARKALRGLLGQDYQ